MRYTDYTIPATPTYVLYSPYEDQFYFINDDIFKVEGTAEAWDLVIIGEL